jgi:hypothetical protein
MSRDEPTPLMRALEHAMWVGFDQASKHGGKVSAEETMAELRQIRNDFIDRTPECEPPEGAETLAALREMLGLNVVRRFARWQGHGLAEALCELAKLICRHFPSRKGIDAQLYDEDGPRLIVRVAVTEGILPVRESLDRLDALHDDWPSEWPEWLMVDATYVLDKE